jgi:hypothetical protein
MEEQACAFGGDKAQEVTLLYNNLVFW